MAVGLLQVELPPDCVNVIPGSENVFSVGSYAYNEASGTRSGSLELYALAEDSTASCDLPLPADACKVYVHTCAILR